MAFNSPTIQETFDNIAKESFNQGYNKAMTKLKEAIVRNFIDDRFRKQCLKELGLDK